MVSYSVIQSLLHSRKFWIAVFGLVQTILFHLLPTFPPEIWQAIDTLAAVLIIAIAAEDVALKLAGRHPTQLAAIDPTAGPVTTTRRPVGINGGAHG
jgi:hypothetical protein